MFVMKLFAIDGINLVIYSLKTLRKNPATAHQTGDGISMKSSLKLTERHIIYGAPLTMKALFWIVSFRKGEIGRLHAKC